MPEAPISLEKTSIPIPPDVPVVSGWKEIPIIHTAEKDNNLVALGPFSNFPTIFTDSIYGGERIDSPYLPKDYDLKNPVHLDGSLITMFVRPGVAEALLTAQSLLPPRHYLIIHDAYRTLQVQQALYDQYLLKLKEQHPDWNDSQLSEETQKYVSLPSSDPSKPSPHNTGGAVDVAIIKVDEQKARRINEIERQIRNLSDDNLKRYELEIEMITIKNHGKYLNFGTNFDHGSEKASLTYFERLAKQKTLTPEEREAQENRRFLYSVMKAVGFEAYPDEWWHYNSPKSQMGAKSGGLDHAEYGSMVLSNENTLHERMRTQHRIGVERIAAGWKRPLYKRSVADRILGRGGDPLVKQFKVVKKAIERHGNYTETKLPQAEKISP